MPKNYPKLGQTVYQFIIYFPTKTTVFLLRMFPCTLVTSCVCLQSIPKPTTCDLSSDRSVHKIRLDLTLRWKKVTKISSYQMVVKIMVMNPHGIESVNKNHTTKKHIEGWMPYILSIQRSMHPHRAREGCSIPGGDFLWFFEAGIQGIVCGILITNQRS